MFRSFSSGVSDIQWVGLIAARLLTLTLISLGSYSASDPSFRLRSHPLAQSNPLIIKKGLIQSDQTTASLLLSLLYRISLAGWDGTCTSVSRSCYRPFTWHPGCAAEQQKMQRLSDRTKKGLTPALLLLQKLTTCCSWHPPAHRDSKN